MSVHHLQAPATVEARPRSIDIGFPSRPTRPRRLVHFVDAFVVLGFGASALLVAFAFLLGPGWNAVGHALAFVVVLHVARLRDTRLAPRVGDELPELAVRIGLAFVVVSPWRMLTSTISKTSLALFVVFVAVVVARFVAYRLRRALRAGRIISKPALIVGQGDVARRLAWVLRGHPEYGLDPVGFVDDDDNHESIPPVVGSVSELRDLMEELGVHRVIVAFGNRRSSDMVRILRACDRAKSVLYVVPRFFELGLSPQSRDVDDVWGIPIVRLRRSILRPWARLLKRTFDIVVASALLLLLGPLLVVVTAIVKLSSQGPVLFRQLRLGQNGRPIHILKFRTMRLNDDSDELWNPSGDSRVTRVGDFLRRTSLDELPQLWNVVRGEMSLVGPRPERPVFVDRFSTENAHYEDRQRVPAGVTGWAQVHGLRGDTSIEERTTFDNYYIEHWSLLLDLIILGRTVTTVVRDALR